jgi:hypothetical protein
MPEFRLMRLSCHFMFLMFWSYFETDVPVCHFSWIQRPLNIVSFTFLPYYRKSSQESDSESARETSSDSSSGYCHERGQKSNHGSRNHLNALDACNHALEKVSLSKPFTGSPSEETESCNPPGQLIFQYFEHETPYNREPLADKARLNTETIYQ